MSTNPRCAVADRPFLPTTSSVYFFASPKSGQLASEWVVRTYQNGWSANIGMHGQLDWNTHVAAIRHTTGAKSSIVGDLSSMSSRFDKIIIIR